MLGRSRSTRSFRARLSPRMSPRIFGLDTIPDVKMRAKLEKQGDTVALRITEGAEELNGLPEGAEVEIALQLSKADAETACTPDVHEVNPPPSPAHLARDRAEEEMSDDRIWSDDYTEADWDACRPVPGALQWVKEHGDEYVGEWVAIGAKGLVAHGETFEEMKDQLPSLRGVMIMQLV